MRPVHIVPREPDKNGVTSSQQTKVYIGNTQLEGVTAISVKYEVDEPVRAQIDFCDCWQEPVTASGDFYMRHPVTGARKQLTRIEFADGDCFDCR